MTSCELMPTWRKSDDVMLLLWLLADDDSVLPGVSGPEGGGQYPGRLLAGEQEPALQLHPPGGGGGAGYVSQLDLPSTQGTRLYKRN